MAPTSALPLGENSLNWLRGTATRCAAATNFDACLRMLAGLDNTPAPPVNLHKEDESTYGEAEHILSGRHAGSHSSRTEPAAGRSLDVGQTADVSEHLQNAVAYFTVLSVRSQSP